MDNKKKSDYCTGLDRPWGFQDIRYMKVVCCQSYAQAAFMPEEIFLLLISGP